MFSCNLSKTRFLEFGNVVPHTLVENHAFVVARSLQIPHETLYHAFVNFFSDMLSFFPFTHLYLFIHLPFFFSPFSQPKSPHPSMYTSSNQNFHPSERRKTHQWWWHCVLWQIGWGQWSLSWKKCRIFMNLGYFCRAFYIIMVDIDGVVVVWPDFLWCGWWVSFSFVLVELVLLLFLWWTCKETFTNTMDVTIMNMHATQLGWGNYSMLHLFGTTIVSETFFP